jgi:hypothetical protein
MMPAKLRTLLETYRLNFRLTQWPETVLDPLAEPVTVLEAFHERNAAIRSDVNLTTKGKDAARAKAATEALTAIGRWHTPNVTGIDQDLGAQRAALVPTPKQQPDGRQIDFILSHLRDKTPQEIAVLYNSATDDRRLLMEVASASVGDIPRKAADGGMEWKPLLDPETVNESVMARAAQKNPQAVAKLNELAEIRAMHVTVAGHAVAEIREALGGVSVDA